MKKARETKNRDGAGRNSQWKRRRQGSRGTKFLPSCGPRSRGETRLHCTESQIACVWGWGNFQVGSSLVPGISLILSVGEESDFDTSILSIEEDITDLSDENNMELDYESAHINITGERPGRSRAQLMDSVTTATPVQRSKGPGSDAQHQSWPGNPVLTPTWDRTEHMLY
ncbi:hypothetical protein CEXT_43621 [Caerostris extrusa]|uniref:Uncharacterized protein n=1 Tax=Caerostris extrusa TaxID=172846 RepID=A0AAV4NK94_CAEEX|nr:hypothetical protein CEXT_43621 [Caerostris extrusa]